MLSLSLYPYQDSAVDKFLDRGSLLVAYEMGLGKSIIATAAAEELFGEDEIDMCALVVPAALKYQWAKNLAKYTDVDTRTIKVQGEQIVVPTEEYCSIIDGTPKQREAAYRMAALRRVDYVILGYENVVNDWLLVKRLDPGMIVLDEATAIKSFKAQRSKKVKRWDAPYRMALTGTPVENRPEELFSIMQWVDPDLLGRFDLFDKSFIVRNHFGGVKAYKNLPTLHGKVQQVVSRKKRLDPDVRDYLPEVSEDVWRVKVDPRIRETYTKIADDLLAELESINMSGGFDVGAYYSGKMQPDENTALGKIMSRQQAMEMLLDHPALVVASATKYNDPASKEGSKYAAELLAGGWLEGLKSSAKLDRVYEEVVDILDSHPGNKVVIFSVYREMGRVLAVTLPYKSVLFHGEMNAGQKAAAQAQFEKDPDTRLFLSSHAGGYGVDLFMANHLINYDLAWSAGKQDQINARHVRASSEFSNVFIHNVLVANTVEDRKYQMLAHKRRVAGSIIDGIGSDTKGKIENDLVSLSEFLRGRVS
jgi:SNF2 family DNA or RNA helicase